MGQGPEIYLEVFLNFLNRHKWKALGVAIGVLGVGLALDGPKIEVTEAAKAAKESFGSVASVLPPNMIVNLAEYTKLSVETTSQIVFGGLGAMFVGFGLWLTQKDKNK